MPRALTRKGIADLRTRPLQTFLLFLVVGIGAATLTLAVLVRESTSRSYEDFLADANGGHVWLFSSEERLSAIAGMPGVAAAGYPMAALDGGRLLSSDESPSLSYFALDAQPSDVSPAMLTNGRWLTPNADHEAVIDRGLAHEAGVELGDSVYVSGRAGTIEVTVVGFAVPTSRAPFPVWEPARVFVSDQTLSELDGGNPDYFAAGYVLDDPDSAPKFLEEALAAYNESGISGRDWETIRDAVVEENDATFILLGVFAAFALVASAFIMANAITGQVQSQSRDIGLLKAIGFTPLQVASLLTLETLVVGVAAGCTGLLAGWLASPLFLDEVKDWLPRANAAAPGPVHVLLVFGGIGLLVVFACLAPALRAGRSSTASALGLARFGTGGRTSKLAKMAAAANLPPSAILGAKDLFSRPARAWLTVGAVAVASAAVVAALTMEATIDTVLADPTAVGGEPFELQLEPLDAPGDITSGEQTPQMTHEEVLDLIESDGRIDRYLTRLWFWITINGEAVAAYSVGGEFDQFDYPLVEGRLMRAGDGQTVYEAIAGYKLATQLGLKVGDRMGFSFAGTDIFRTMEIVGIYVENDNDGVMLSFARDDIATVDPEVPYGAYGLKLAPGADSPMVAADLVARSAGKVVVRDIRSDIKADVDRIREELRPIMAGLSVFLLAMVSANLLSTLLLSVRERTREIGLLKAIGFTPAQIVVSIVSGAMVLALLGIALGAPLGWLFVRFVFEQSASDGGYDAAAIVQTPSPVWYLVLVWFGLAIASFGSFWAASRAARLPVSAALRYE